MLLVASWPRCNQAKHKFLKKMTQPGPPPLWKLLAPTQNVSSSLELHSAVDGKAGREVDGQGGAMVEEKGSGSLPNLPGISASADRTASLPGTSPASFPQEPVASIASSASSWRRLQPRGMPVGEASRGSRRIPSSLQRCRSRRRMAAAASSASSWYRLRFFASQRARAYENEM